MTDLSHQAYAPRAATERASSRRPWPLLPYVCVFVAGAAGLCAGRAMGGDAAAFEDKLLLLLRFMAVMKLVGVLAAAGLTHWRLTSPIAWGRAAGYLGALGTMAAATGLIWSLGAIAIGAVMFHVGLLVFLALAWKDDGVRLPIRR